MIVYEITTENDVILAYFFKESLAKHYCETGRNLKYKKATILYDSIDIFYHKGDEKKDENIPMDRK